MPAAQSSAAGQPTGIIDTNVDLFTCPFRKLKYGDTHALVAKLKKHRVIEAWAGSFEALFKLLHFTGTPRGDDLRELMTQTTAVMDISRLEGNGAVGRTIGLGPGIPVHQVPVDRIVVGSHAPYFPVETAIQRRETP